MDQLTSNEILETLESLKEAKENLKRIDEQYYNEPEIHQIYSYSAKELIGNLESHLEYLLNNQTNSKFTLTSSVDDVDVWVHIEGDKYNEGRGPINSIGTYLKKLNTAAKHTISILKEQTTSLEESKFDTYFELVETAKGSLKLGLKGKVDRLLNEDEGTLFENDPDRKVFHLDEYSKVRKLISDSMALILKTLSSADDEKVSKEIFDEYGENNAIKLYHFAKELAPSSRSNINQVTFEGRLLPKNKPYIKIDSVTRRNLTSKSKQMIQNKEFIQGTALVEEYKNNVNVAYYSLIAKPLKYNKESINVELRLDKDKHIISENEVLNQLLEIEGFLHFDNKSDPTYVAVDEVTFDNDDDLSFNEK